MNDNEYAPGYETLDVANIDGMVYRADRAVLLVTSTDGRKTAFVVALDAIFRAKEHLQFVAASLHERDNPATSLQ